MQDRGQVRLDLDLELLNTLFTSIDQGFCLCEILTDAAGRPKDYRFLAVNPLFESMTGLVGAEGRTALDLVPGLEPFWIETYGRVALEREPIRFKEGAEALGRWFDVFAAPVEPPGRFALVFRDITEQRRIADEREVALARAKALLEELNHRVMNSLGMIAAVVSLEARSRQEGAGRRALERVGDRVHAVADLYRTLSATNRVDAVQADDYLSEVVRRLGASIGADHVRLEIDVEPVSLPTTVAAPIGLAVNELVTNAVKYAFGPGEAGRVEVALRTEGGRLLLVVRDDGRGLGGTAPSWGLGGRLVEAFARQLGGEVRFETCGGTRVVVDVPFPGPSPD